MKRSKLDVASLSEDLGVSKTTIYGWIKNGKVDGTTNIGHQWGIKVVYLDSLPEKYLNTFLAKEGKA